MSDCAFILLVLKQATEKMRVSLLTSVISKKLKVVQRVPGSFQPVLQKEVETQSLGFVLPQMIGFLCQYQPTTLEELAELLELFGRKSYFSQAAKSRQFCG
jgi:hypothetical protein